MIRFLTLLVLSLALPLGAATKTVGPGAANPSFNSILPSLAPGDIVVVYAGTLSEPGTAGYFSRHNVEIYGTNRDLCILDSFTFTDLGSNCFIHDLTFQNWPARAINDVVYNSWTISNCVFLGNNQIYTSGDSSSAIYVQAVADTLIISNSIYGGTNNALQKGINVASVTSLDGAYTHGTRIIGNMVTNTPNDGIDVHGQWITIEGNYVQNTIDQHWAANHPDGIQLIKSIVNTITNVTHCKIRWNVVSGHTQGIFCEGMGANSIPCKDVDIYGNVVYNPSATVNGVALDSLTGAKGVMLKGCQDVRVYGNYGGRYNGFDLDQQTDGATNGATLFIKNNIWNNALGQGLAIEDGREFAIGAIDYNVYFGMPSQVVSWNPTGGGATTYATRALFRAAVTTQEQATLVGSGDTDPLINALPTPTLQVGSPCINEGVNLGSPYNIDPSGNNQDLYGNWDIGVFVATGSGVIMAKRPPASRVYRTSFK